MIRTSPVGSPDPDLTASALSAGMRVELGVAPLPRWCYTSSVPTTHPRYTVTDTGELRAMLDLAQRRWPAVEGRRELLLRLASAGAERIASELDAAAAASRREQQRQALARAPELVDAETLLTDSAWR